LPTSKDITIVGGFIPPSGISPLNRRSAKLLDPVSTKSGEGHSRGFFLRCDQLAIDQHLGDLNRVERRAFAEVV
jgi:hypothetical protein